MKTWNDIRHIINPWGEWSNPDHFAAIHAILTVGNEHELITRDESIGYIRANRPRQKSPEEIRATLIRHWHQYEAQTYFRAVYETFGATEHGQQLIRGFCGIPKWVNIAELENPRPSTHDQISRDLEQNPITYGQAFTYLQTIQVRLTDGEARAGQQWWGEIRSQAHLMNALLRRGDMNIMQLQRELGIPSGKLYQYLADMGVKFRSRPTLHTQAIDVDTDAHPEPYDATIVALDERRPGYALLNLDGYESLWVAEWRPNEWKFALKADVRKHKKHVLEDLSNTTKREIDTKRNQFKFNSAREE